MKEKFEELISNSEHEYLFRLLSNEIQEPITQVKEYGGQIRDLISFRYKEPRYKFFLSHYRTIENFLHYYNTSFGDYLLKETDVIRIDHESVLNFVWQKFKEEILTELYETKESNYELEKRAGCLYLTITGESKERLKTTIAITGFEAEHYMDLVLYFLEEEGEIY